MATETTTKLIDDLDGSAADQTVEFSFLGTHYEIDLTKKHTEQMRKALQPWMESARRQGRTAPRRRVARRQTVAQKRATNDEIRAWAKEHGLKVADKGRIPVAVVEQYRAGV